VRVQQMGGFMMQVQQECEECGGTGRIPKYICAHCQGKKLIQETVDRKVNWSLIVFFPFHDFHAFFSVFFAEFSRLLIFQSFFSCLFFLIFQSIFEARLSLFSSQVLMPFFIICNVFENCLMGSISGILSLEIVSRFSSLLLPGIISCFFVP
jgi:hypothetical protein